MSLNVPCHHNQLSTKERKNGTDSKRAADMASCDICGKPHKCTKPDEHKWTDLAVPKKSGPTKGTKAKKEVWVKVYRQSDAQERAKQELQKLRNGGIAPVPYCATPVVQNDQSVFIVMESLRECKALEQSAITLELVGKIKEAIDAIHKCGVHHNDLKPEHIKIQNGNIRIIDFDLATMVDDPAAFQSRYSAKTDKITTPNLTLPATIGAILMSF